MYGAYQSCTDFSVTYRKCDIHYILALYQSQTIDFVRT